MLWLVAILLAVVLVVVMFVRISQLQLPKGDNMILHPHKPVIGNLFILICFLFQILLNSGQV